VMDEVVAEVTRPFGFPLVTDVEIGHADPALTLPIGCAIDVWDRQLTVLEPGVV
jgi:muramoyltetrapeptide carboxypeptidase LdcA involved in peptidoglycan recycling